MDEIDDSQTQPAAEEAQAPLESSATGLPQSVILEAYVRLKFGPKHLDQAAGFIHWCGKNGRTRHTRAEWDALLSEFSNKPVGA